MLNSAKSRTTSEQVKKTRQIKDVIRQKLRLGDDVTVMVTELKCTEPGCPPLETVIAILGINGRQLQRKIHRSIVEIADGDLETAGELLQQEMAHIELREAITKENCNGDH